MPLSSFKFSNINYVYLGHRSKFYLKDLAYNTFDTYFDNLDKNLTNEKMKDVLNEIKNHIYFLPPFTKSFLPNGGQGYIEMIQKYN